MSHQAADARTMTKAVQYIADGRVQIVTVTRDIGSLYVDALVQGSATDPYAVAFIASRWTCDCPARALCAHIVAVALVTDPRGEATSATPADDGHLRYVPADVFGCFPGGAS